MAESAPASVAVNGVVGVSARRTEAMPGPGMFVSRNGRLYAAMIVKTTPQRDPRNTERFIDVPVLDANGQPMMIQDPAALDSLRKWSDGKPDEKGEWSHPVMQSPEYKSEVVTGLQGLQESIKLLMEQNNKTLSVLAAAIAGKTAPAEISPAKRRGRPPKVS